MTKRETYLATIEILKAMDGTEELVKAYEDYIAKLDTKTSTRKEDPVKVALKAKVLKAVSESEKPLSIDEIKETDEELAQCKGSQKISAYLSQLRKEGKVKRVMDGKKSKYTLGLDAEYLKDHPELVESESEEVGE